MPKITTKINVSILDLLVNETIKSVSLSESDLYGDGVNVVEEYTIVTQSGKTLIFSCDAGCDSQYARLELGSV